MIVNYRIFDGGFARGVTNIARFDAIGFVRNVTYVYRILPATLTLIPIKFVH